MTESKNKIITSRYELCRRGKWTISGEHEFGMALEEVELPGFAARRAVEWSRQLQEDIYVHDQVRDHVPIIIRYSATESFQTQVCRYRRRILRYERYDGTFDAYFEVQRLDRIVRVLKGIRKSMNRKMASEVEADGNGRLLLF